MILGTSSTNNTNNTSHNSHRNNGSNNASGNYDNHNGNSKKISQKPQTLIIVTTSMRQNMIIITIIIIVIIITLVAFRLTATMVHNHHDHSHRSSIIVYSDLMFRGCVWGSGISDFIVLVLAVTGRVVSMGRARQIQDISSPSCRGACCSCLWMAHTEKQRRSLMICIPLSSLGLQASLRALVALLKQTACRSFLLCNRP